MLEYGDVYNFFQLLRFSKFNLPPPISVTTLPDTITKCWVLTYTIYVSNTVYPFCVEITCTIPYSQVISGAVQVNRRKYSLSYCILFGSNFSFHLAEFCKDYYALKLVVFNLILVFVRCTCPLFSVCFSRLLILAELSCASERRIPYLANIRTRKLPQVRTCEPYEISSILSSTTNYFPLRPSLAYVKFL